MGALSVEKRNSTSPPPPPPPPPPLYHEREKGISTSFYSMLKERTLATFQKKREERKGHPFPRERAEEISMRRRQGCGLHLRFRLSLGTSASSLRPVLIIFAIICTFNCSHNGWQCATGAPNRLLWIVNRGWIISSDIYERLKCTRVDLAQQRVERRAAQSLRRKGGCRDLVFPLKFSVERQRIYALWKPAHTRKQ